MKLLKPHSGEYYYDIKGRGLFITKVDIGSKLGREVQGNLINKDASVDYSCTLKTWADIWRDKTPRIEVSQMKIG